MSDAEITVFTKLVRPGDPDGALLSKRIELRDGKPASDGSTCRMATGIAITAPAPDAAALASLIEGMLPCNALALGSINGADGTTMNVVTAPRLAKLSPVQRGNNTISRTREFIAFRPGAPAWALLDYDCKWMPTPIKGRLDAVGGFWPALLAVVPGLGRAARVVRASTTAGLWSRDTGEHFAGSGGLHVYLQIQDGADVDRALQTVHERAWLHGLGWFVIGGAGQLLERSIIDPSVRFSEHLVFEGAPDVVLPLMQDPMARACQAVDGTAIDSRVVVPDLTRNEAQQVEALKMAARKALEPQALVVRAAADNGMVADIIQRTGVPYTTAMRQVAARHRGLLTPDIELVTDHIGTVTVREILADPDRFIGETLCDPLEGPNYGHDKAKVMRSQHEPGRIYINSFAHGGGTYDLKHDFRTAEARLEAVPEANLGDVLCETVDAADLEDDETRQLLALCAKRAPKVGIQAFTRRLKADRERRAKARRHAASLARQAAGATDDRHRRPVPPADGELTPVIAELDRVLSKDESDSPPMRRPDGTLVELRVEAPFALHQLAATGANGEADTEANQLPAPAEPMLVAMTPITIEVMLERYFVWVRTDKDGDPLYHAALPAVFVNAFMQMSGSESKLPHVNAVNTAPMVAENGSIIDGIGLDRDSGLYHHIEPALRDCLPQCEITEADVRAAIRWLCDVWLLDVLTGIGGKLVAISMALTLIERHLLMTRPAFLISAGQRGGGKTTLAHMMVIAVYGRMAAAASWSENQEERRKALFAHFLQGVAALVWDNIKNGAEISCPEVEKALTSPTIRDRVLGVSRGETVPTTTVQIFIGNNVKFAGDMASRGPEIRLLTDEPRPEDRAVAHVDPIGWTLANRAKIMRCLYILLLYGCRNRPHGQVAKTRFKTWWSLAGWPVELAASLLDPPVELDFVTVFRAAEEQDSRAAGVAAALRLLNQEFGSVERDGPHSNEAWFAAKDIREILDAGELARALLRTDQTEQGKIERARAFLELYENLTGRRNRSPITHAISQALGGIEDRPVNLDLTTVGILRAKTLHGAKRFRVEVHSGGAGRQVFESPLAGERETGITPHPATPEGANEHGEGWQGEENAPLAVCSAPPRTKTSKENVRPPQGGGLDWNRLQPTAEEVPVSEHLILDVETFSTVDLKRAGLHFYAAHPDTGVSVACYAFGSAGEVQTWFPGQPVPKPVQRHITGGGTVIAHNCAFEAAILRHILGPHHGWPVPKLHQWNCTLSRAAYHAFPGALEALSEAVPLTNKKDKEGHALMLRMARRRGFTPDGKPRWWHDEDPPRLMALTEYCRKDVLAEQELNRRLPELPDRERRLWLMDAEINDRGIMIDVAGADALARATASEVAGLNAEMAAVTDNGVTTVSSVPALKAWLADRGLAFESLDKEHMASALRRNDVQADPAALRALQLRQEGALASTAKLKPMLGTLGNDNRARGLFQYYGAGRTGRWAGRRIQPQNLVRGLVDAASIIDAMIGGAALPQLAKQHECHPLALVAGCLRGLFVAPEGRRLVAVDLSQIEARVLAWLAGQEDLLEVFRDREQDVYLYTAAMLGSEDRQLGKVATLGLGFQMAAERFADAAKGYGVILTDGEATHHVRQWRQENPMIVRLWRDVEDTVKAVARGPVGGEAEVGRCLIRRKPGSIRIRLPSGRELIYHAMDVVERASGWDGIELAFMGVHPLSKLWVQQRTYGGRLVENITQATARDVLAEAMLVLRDRGHRIVGSVHDEILLETDATEADALLNETLELLRTTPAWAEGLPVDASGFVSPRYRKY